ncbi:gluconokinase [Muricauda sp. SCSIO 64092]|uniref:gluconokinase n=1 Tax=Allomuricauda sp. SCSIO 64092 TaxID=2908842 RepID=UPI001FF17470|nr:gluconokinase [Muricauda sp. SCSIO 64092]UOY06918.1 gluconokinase [Muricauda sp. SCSIO 64092]
MHEPKLYVIMGVSGTGKTTIGKLLAEAVGIPFFDGDDFHPRANLEKMESGQPLNDEDRHGWLVSLNQLLKSRKESGAVVACSALKKSYRAILNDGLMGQLKFIFLEGSFEEVKTRMVQRKGHFMPLELLQSQFETLEEPENAIKVSIRDTPSQIIQKLLDQL